MTETAGRKILLIGGGGHCHSVADAALSIYSGIGIVEKDAARRESFMGIHIAGTDDDLPRLFSEGWKEAFITVGSTGDASIRRRLFEKVKSLGFRVPAIVDPSAAVARDAEIKEGAFVGKRAVVNSGCVIGQCAIVNTGVIVEHDCAVGDFSHVSPGAVLCGEVSVGNDTHIGAGSVVRQGLTVGGRTMIGMGSVVVKDIPGNVRAWGNPCRVVD